MTVADGARPGASDARDPAGHRDATASGGEAGGAATGPATRAGRPRRRFAVLRETVLLVAIALSVSALLRAFVVQAFYIPSQSMEDTLRIDDRILVSKLTPRFRDVQRGSIVVFRDPGGWLGDVGDPPPPGPGRWLRDLLTFVGLRPSDSGQDLVKRVIGVPGDRVRCCDAEGSLLVNEVPLDEPYLFPGDEPSTTSFDVRVPDGRLWMMGDHRSASGDSRAHLDDPGGGFVPVGNVVGRAFVVVWPLDHWQTLGRPATFTQPALSGGLALLPGVLAAAAVAALRRRRARGWAGGRSRRRRQRAPGPPGTASP